MYGLKVGEFEHICRLAVGDLRTYVRVAAINMIMC